MSECAGKSASASVREGEAESNDLTTCDLPISRLTSHQSRFMS
jgi:hypothetical protein